VVTLTARNKGTVGNDIDLRANYYDGEELPSGLSLAIVAMASGANDPDLADAVAVMADEWFQIISGPYADLANLGAMKTELTSRASATRMIDGMYITAVYDTPANLSTLGKNANLNSPWIAIVGAFGIPEMPYELAAGIAGQAAAEFSVDPARPLQTIQVIGIKAPKTEDKFTFEENNGLLFDGIATIDTRGVVRIQRLITTYRTNDSGATDIAYLDATTVFTLMYLRYDFRTQIQTRYGRAKLVDDATRIQSGQQVISPAVGKAEAVAIARQWEKAGLVENIDQFKAELICRRSPADPNRLEWIMSPDLVNQFRVGAATIQFLLQGQASA
jgi:phage tail sheath gpL-like